MMHPDMADLIRHVKAKRHGSNLTTIITNAFLLTQQNIRDLNAAGLDFMQVSVDTILPNALSQKSLKSVLPKLKLLADEARFKVEIQTVLCEESYACYEEFRRILKDFPFAFGFSLQHERGGKIAVQGHKFLELLRKYGVFEGVNFYGHHLQQMILGDFSQPWRCLGGFKFIYVNAQGYVQWCAQQRNYQYPLEKITPRELKANGHHKPCEAGCALGCVRMVSHTLGQPLKTLGASLSLVFQMRKYTC
jgi:MoaA/NifB/PqqE/SkfB family radical SAM enzyme